MNRRHFLKRFTAGCASAALAPALLSQCSRPRQPNILFIFADDMAFDTLNAMGYEQIETPNLDRLSRRGVIFSHAYNMGAWHGAVCVASRTMLNTGRFLWHAQELEPNLETARDNGEFWSQHMQAAGYETYMTGKWHVSNVQPPSIFNHVRDVRPGMPNQTPEGYHRPKEGEPDEWKPWDKSKGGFWKGGTHWSEIVGNHTLDFIDHARESDKPFFMYVAFNAPHDPRQSPKSYVEKYPLDDVDVPRNFQPLYPDKDAIGCGEDLRDEYLAPFPRTPYAVQVHRQEYYAIISHMDTQIGRILDALETSGMAENTYIVFAADHGLACGHHGLLGKQNMYDHSVRAPLIINGPGVEPGTEKNMPVYLQDVMPTTLEWAGAERPETVEFRSLLPLLRGEREQNYEAIYGGYMNLQRMVTDGRRKLIYYPNAEKYLFFNLETDPDEVVNLIDEPDYAAEIESYKKQLVQLQGQVGDELELK